MLVIILIIVLIIVINQNSQLKKEIAMLKAENSRASLPNNNKPAKVGINREFFCPMCGQQNSKERNGVCSNCGYVLNESHEKNIAPEIKAETNFIKQTPKPKAKPVRNEEEIKNNAILITGAVLIILSAILFLATTWNTSENYLKTVILVFMFIVFLGTSKIAEKVFKLDYTARAFFNIALSYLPILLFSISLFGLLGDYLSINGEGKYIYLALSSLAVTAVYYTYSVKRNSKFLVAGSYIFLVISEILLELIFTNNVTLIISGLLLFNMITTFLLPKILDITYLKINEKFNIVNFIALCIITFLYTFSSIFNGELSIETLILFIISLVSSKYMLTKYKEEEIYRVLFPILVELIIYNFMQVFILQSVANPISYNYFTLCSLIMGVLFIFAVDVYNKKTFDPRLYIELFIFLCIFLFESLLSALDMEFLILLLTGYLTFEVRKYNKEYRYLTNYLIPVIANIGLVFFFKNFSINYIYLPIAELILFNVVYFYDKNNNDIKEAFKLITTPFLIISLFANIIFNFDNNLTNILLIVSCINYFVYGILEKKDLYKVLSYILLNVTASKLFYDVSANVYFLILPLVTVLITLLNEIIKESKVKWYLIVQYVFAFLFIYIPDVSIHTIIFLIALGFIYHLFVSDKNSLEKYMPIIALIPLIYMIPSFLSEYNVLISSMLIISLTLASVYKKDVNDYTKLSYGYLILHCITFSYYKYISLILLVFLPLMHTFTTYYKQKDVFKVLSYVFTYILLLNIVNDYFKEYSVLLFVIISTYMLLLVSRTLIKKYVKDYKVIEYILLSIINLYAVGNIMDMNDAIIITLFFLLNVLIGYIYKFGPLLMVSLVSLLYAVFKLTESFWLSISWWVYVLAMGCILVIFAINNEIKSKENRPKIDFNKIKEKFDL